MDKLRVRVRVRVRVDEFELELTRVRVALVRTVKNHPARSDGFVSYLRGLVGFDFRG